MNDNIKLLRLGLNQDEKEKYMQNEQENNIKMTHILRRAREQAKLNKCYTCGKECSSFCNSHSVPQFCLRNIAESGKVYSSGIQNEIPLMGADSGVKNAGTFKLICRECDSTLFQDYENCDAYNQVPTGKMLAEIALKNYLQMISKRLQERELYKLLQRYDPDKIDLTGQLDIIELDLQEYRSGLQRAKTAVLKNHEDWYHLCYYKHLDYVVPIATQGAITLISDFSGNVINNIYNTSPDYRTKQIHLAVFPLEKSSVVLMFHDSREKRYRNFYRQLGTLDLQDQLAAINYIIHSYSENVFLSKRIRETVLKDKNFLDACKKSFIAIASIPCNPLQKALEEFDLSKRHEIPNLLSIENKLDSFK